ncbi:hypothetical protein CFC21_038957 [Triticum aestivum]|uniref:F-box domain-containing protein n=2 Tax=Triticum aestivum TaxID=4565 RepID=A0A3B6UAC7_WHEAT|nr:hypothetical protein CFC21_038957 [Triticum aestivum]
MNAADHAAGTARRRSPRLHPQFQASEEGAGLDLRRSACLRPPVHASDERDGVTRRRSPRLHSQVQAREHGAGVARRPGARLGPQGHASVEASGVTRRSRRRGRRGRSPLEDDDLLCEILLRLPPQPSSLPRASAVCKRWRRAVTDPRFHRRFCQHHWKPPLLGFFEPSADGIVFTSVLDPPNRIPPQRFDLRLHGIDSGRGTGVELLGCRHGRLLIMHWQRAELIVIAPFTGKKLCLTIPSKFNGGCYLDGVVLCGVADHGHVHGSCHSSPFKVVLLSTSTYDSGPQPAFACVFSSKTGIWSDHISTPTPYQLHGTDSHGSLIGNSLYWMCDDYIFQFDLDGQSLALIRAPPRINDVRHRYDQREIIQVVDGIIGVAILSHYYHNIQIWQREVNCQGVTKWVLWKTIDMHDIHGIPHGNEGERPKLIFRLRYAEDTDDIFIYVGRSIYMVQLKSMQSMKLCETGYIMCQHSLKSFYMPGAAIASGRDGAEMLHET